VLLLFTVSFQNPELQECAAVAYLFKTLSWKKMLLLITFEKALDGIGPPVVAYAVCEKKLNIRRFLLLFFLP
jgi:hypothetical protein